MSALLAMLQKHPGAQSSSSALREVMQEIALAGLFRAGFFNHAAFYGGTCLRIFYGLPRFSEDLDFSLLRSEPGFSLQPFFQALIDEFLALGISVDLTEKKKTARTPIVSAFLKKTSSIYDITLLGRAQNAAHSSVKIKFEIDTDPPLGYDTQPKLLLQPFSCYVNCFSLPDLFAGKVHALMYRKWKQRVKGRDWFDFEWYVRSGHAMSLRHFNTRALQSGDLECPYPSADALRQALQEKINSVSFSAAKLDVLPFIEHPQALDIWSAPYFLDVLSRMNIQP